MPQTKPIPIIDPVQRLQNVVDRLRGENGCPWDRKQTPESMAVYLKEEAHEVADAVAAGNPADICEELGDVLFLVVFIARLFAETGRFDFTRVAEGVTEKMVRRHPHIFGDERAETPEEVLHRWRRIKRAEKQAAGRPEKPVPASLPLLIRSVKLLKQTPRPKVTDAVSTFDANWRRLKTRLTEETENTADFTLQIGSLFFQLIALSHGLRVHPEAALASFLAERETGNQSEPAP